MSDQKPAPWVTYLLLSLGTLQLADSIRWTIEHQRSWGFTPLELGIVVALILLSTWVALSGVFQTSTPGRSIGMRRIVLIGIACVALFAGKYALERAIFRREERLIDAWDTAWSYLTAGALLGWGIARLRKARSANSDAGPGVYPQANVDR